MGKRQVYKRHYLGFTTETVNKLRRPVDVVTRRQTFINSIPRVVNTVSQLVLQQNFSRKYLVIQNTSTTDDVVINFGSTASVTPRQGLTIPTLGTYSAESESIPQDAIYAVSSATATIVILEG